MPTTPDQFTALARQEYFTAQQEVFSQPPAPAERFMETIGSTSRIETHILGSMPGQMKEFKGYLEAQKFDTSTYQIPNKPYYNSFEVNRDDIEDDKFGMYLKSARVLVERAKQFTTDLALQTLCTKGETLNSPDGSAYFATTHNQGSVFGTIGAGQGGGNVVNFTAASNDGAAHKLIFTVNSMAMGIKPVLIQERRQLSALQTDQGTPEAEKKQKYLYWCDARYGIGLGWWWDSILVKITNTPTLAELSTIFGRVFNRFRQFRLPEGSPQDPPRAVHQAITEFNPENTTILNSSQLFNDVRILLSNEMINTGGGGFSNTYRGTGTQITVPYLDE